ncbi:MAG: Gfo/Idh/MocA family oxidoreductase [Planctomycetes bacterium]|nr:Gfo/Idh/MocA family oxidoreductase [Planctomycetota bacterium]
MTDNPMSSTSRRQFLKATAAAGAALLVESSIARAAFVSSNETLRVGLVGCGGRGRGAAVQALKADPNAKLVALADAFADHIEKSIPLLKKSPVGDRVVVDPDHRFAGFDAYKQLIDSGVDVVLLATPPHFRPIHLKACVEAGKHVFAEKPVAVDAPGIRSVLATCEEAKKKGLSIVSGLMYRYSPQKQETMKRVHDGAIGEIVAIQTTYNCGPPWFRNKPRKPEWTEMEFQVRNWYPFTWLSGDHNVEQHVHSLDKAAWALQDQTPLKAWGTGGRQIRSEITLGNIFDHHCVTYEFENGVRVYSHCRRMAGCSNDISDYILGTKGICDVMKHRIEVGGKVRWRYEGPTPNMYEVEHQELFKSIRRGEPINNGLYMAQSTMWAILGRMVTYTGKTITWERAMKSKENLSPKRYAWDAEPPILPDENGQYPLAIPGITPFV